MSCCRKTKAPFNGCPFRCTVFLPRLCQDILLLRETLLPKNDGPLLRISVFCTVLLLRLCHDILLLQEVVLQKNEGSLQRVFIFGTFFLLRLCHDILLLHEVVLQKRKLPSADFHFLYISPTTAVPRLSSEAGGRPEQKKKALFDWFCYFTLFLYDDCAITFWFLLPLSFFFLFVSLVFLRFPIGFSMVPLVYLWFPCCFLIECI